MQTVPQYVIDQARTNGDAIRAAIRALRAKEDSMSEPKAVRVSEERLEAITEHMAFISAHPSDHPADRRRVSDNDIIDLVASVRRLSAALAAAEQERDEARADFMLANAAPELNGEAIGMARAYIKEHLGISAAFFDDVIHNTVATCLQAQNARDEALAMVAALTDALGKLNKPWADCAFCDSGQLRIRMDGREAFHADDCPHYLATRVLADTASTAQAFVERVRAEQREKDAKIITSGRFHMHEAAAAIREGA